MVLSADLSDTFTEGRKIVQKGSLELPSSRHDLRDRRWNGGFVENSTQTNTDGHAAGRTVRVPVGRLDQAMSEVKNVASVERENVEARDVRREYMILRLAGGMLRRKKHSTCRS